MNPAIVMVRTMQVAFIFSVLVFLYVLHVVHPAPKIVDPSMQLFIACAAFTSIILGFIVPRALLRIPNELFFRAEGSEPRRRWLAGHIFRFATAESVALFGFVLRMMGDTSRVVTAFFAVSLLLLILWQPGEVPAATESKDSIG